MRPLFLGVVVLFVCFLFSCKSQQDEPVALQDEVTPWILDSLNALGFNTVDIEVKKIETGYMVEGDILLTGEQIMNLSPGEPGPTEEYSYTDNLVAGLPRTISMFVNMPQLYNEGDGGVGVIFIPGTPAGPGPGSWMVACRNPKLDRPFINNDQIAFLY